MLAQNLSMAQSAERPTKNSSLWECYVAHFGRPFADPIATYRRDDVHIMEFASRLKLVVDLGSLEKEEIPFRAIDEKTNQFIGGDILVDAHREQLGAWFSVRLNKA